MQGPVIATSVSMSPYEHCLVDSVCHVLLMTLKPLNPANLTSTLPEVPLMFCGVSLHLLPSAARGSLSDDNQARSQSLSIGESH